MAFIADNLATDTGPMFSPAAYREFLKPRLKQIIGAIREFTAAKILYHCCGAVHHFIDDLVECGVDAINPVETSAQGMDPAISRLASATAFPSGAASTRGACSPRHAEGRSGRGAAHDPRPGPGGGYVVNFVDNAQPDVQPENIVAMVEAAASLAATRWIDRGFPQPNVR